MDDSFSGRSKKHHKASEHREFTGGYTSRRIRAVEAMYEREAGIIRTTGETKVVVPKKNLRRK
jgi:hypothetical protein